MISGISINSGRPRMPNGKLTIWKKIGVVERIECFNAWNPSPLKITNKSVYTRARKRRKDGKMRDRQCEHEKVNKRLWRTAQASVRVCSVCRRRREREKETRQNSLAHAPILAVAPSISVRCPSNQLPPRGRCVPCHSANASPLVMSQYTPGTRRMCSTNTLCTWSPTRSSTPRIWFMRPATCAP